MSMWRDEPPVEHDEPPLEVHTCPDCDGRGFHAERITVYEHGCGFPHDDTNEVPCGNCNGTGELVEEAVGVIVDAPALGGLSAWGIRALGFDRRCACCHEDGWHTTGGGRCAVIGCTCKQFEAVSPEPEFEELGREKTNPRCIGCRPANSGLFNIPISCWQPYSGCPNRKYCNDMRACQRQCNGDD